MWKAAPPDLGRARYLATLIGADNETVLRWFILVMALLLDPVRGTALAGRGVGTKLGLSWAYEASPTRIVILAQPVLAIKTAIRRQLLCFLLREDETSVERKDKKGLN